MIFLTESRLSWCILMTIWMFKENLNNEVRIQLFCDLEASSWTSLSVYPDKCASDTCAFTCVYGGCAQAKLSGCLCLSISGQKGLLLSFHDRVCDRSLAGQLAKTNERG